MLVGDTKSIALGYFSLHYVASWLPVFVRHLHWRRTGYGYGFKTSVNIVLKYRKLWSKLLTVPFSRKESKHNLAYADFLRYRGRVISEGLPLCLSVKRSVNTTDKIADAQMILKMRSHAPRVNGAKTFNIWSWRDSSFTGTTKKVLSYKMGIVNADWQCFCSWLDCVINPDNVM